MVLILSCMFAVVLFAYINHLINLGVGKKEIFNKGNMEKGRAEASRAIDEHYKYKEELVMSHNYTKGMACFISLDKSQKNKAREVTQIKACGTGLGHY